MFSYLGSECYDSANRCCFLNQWCFQWCGIYTNIDTGEHKHSHPTHSASTHIVISDHTHQFSVSTTSCLLSLSAPPLCNIAQDFAFLLNSHIHTSPLIWLAPATGLYWVRLPGGGLSCHRIKFGPTAPHSNFTNPHQNIHLTFGSSYIWMPIIQ